MFERVLELLNLGEVVDQAKSEAIVSLATLLYQADSKVKLSEQDLFAQFLIDLPWDNPYISKEVFHRQVIASSLSALKHGSVAEYLSSIVPALKSDPKVLVLLRDLAVADGNVSPEEADILSMVSRLMVE